MSPMTNLVPPPAMQRAPIISAQSRIRWPEHLVVGDYSIIDDYCYLSTRVTIGRCSHVAAGCSIAGGGERHFSMGDFSSLSAGVKIWCTSDDFSNDLVTLLPPGCPAVKRHLISADVTLDRYTAVGANSVVMPGNHVPEGTVIGALSFVPARFDFEPWSVYAGVPVRRIGRRNEAEVRRQVTAIETYLGGIG